MIFEKIPGGAGKFNTWLVNGKPYPHERSSSSSRARATASSCATAPTTPIPCTCIATCWELVEINGKKTAGIIKDTVVVPYYGRAIVDFTANQPGLSLFHCHIQQHMDYGFKALFRYA